MMIEGKDVYLVGGAVRDKLMGLPPQDRDYVVIGVEPEEMIKLGFRRVGSTTPVFLNPQTQEEYFLAQNLEEDLARRDLTINAMALTEDGLIIDPFSGQKDLRDKILRHVSSQFGEDPLRVYRVARFQAQYPDFTIAPETLSLMKEISSQESFAALSGERIFGELRKVLSAARPSLFFQVLKNIDAMKIHFPELENAYVEKLNEIDDSILGFASLMHGRSQKEAESLCERLLVPNDWKETAVMVSRQLKKALGLNDLSPEAIVDMLYEMDAFRKPHLVKTLSVLSANSKLVEIFERIRTVSADDIDSGLKGKEIGEAIRDERIRRVLDGPK